MECNENKEIIEKYDNLSDSVCGSNISINKESTTVNIKKKIVLSSSNNNSNNNNTKFKQELKYVDGKKWYSLPDPKEIIVYNNKSEKYLIACAIMVKNESLALSNTLRSFLPHVDCLIAYDTGSTDDTIDIIKSETEKFGKPLFLITGEFVDFSTSRNVLLKYSNNIAKYLILPDSNDILKGGELIRNMLLDNESSPEDKKWNCVFVTQHWQMTHEIHIDQECLDQYKIDEETAKNIKIQKKDRIFKNTRIIRTNLGWTYNSVIHENLFIQPQILYEGLSIPDNPTQTRIFYNTDIVFFQDREQDNKKSEKRYANDLELLYREYENNPEDSRTVFYIGQTNECMGNTSEAFKWYLKRGEMGDHSEEKYLSIYRAGKISYYTRKNHEETILYFMKANIISFELFADLRAEPLVFIAQCYLLKNLYHQAYYYIREACRLEIPTNLNLIIEKEIYTETRWALAMQTALKLGEFYDARYACKKLAESLGCEVRGNKIDSSHLNKAGQIKAGEFQKFIEICNKQITENTVILSIKDRAESLFKLHKSEMVFPSKTTVQLNEFKMAVASGQVNNFMEMDQKGNLRPYQQNQNQPKKKKSKNKKK